MRRGHHLLYRNTASAGIHFAVAVAAVLLNFHNRFPRFRLARSTRPPQFYPSLTTAERPRKFPVTDQHPDGELGNPR